MPRKALFELNNEVGALPGALEKSLQESVVWSYIAPWYTKGRKGRPSLRKKMVETKKYEATDCFCWGGWLCESALLQNLLDGYLIELVAQKRFFRENFPTKARIDIQHVMVFRCAYASILYNCPMSTLKMRLDSMWWFTHSKLWLFCLAPCVIFCEARVTFFGIIYPTRWFSWTTNDHLDSVDTYEWCETQVWMMFKLAMCGHCNWLTISC